MIIPVNTSSGAVTVTIDSDQLVAGRVLIIKDIGASVSTGNYITIATEGSEKINYTSDALSNTIQLTSNYNTITLFSDGSNWFHI
jgi:hypothetical protein